MNFTSKQSQSTQDDIQMWTHLKEGDEIALGKLIKKYFNHLQNYGFKFVKDEDFVKDCVQEVFIEIWQRREKIATPDSVKAYLLSCVRRKVVREGFRQHIIKDEDERNVESKTEDFDTSPEWLMIEQENMFEISEKVNKSISKLPKRQREVLYLQYYQNLNREEIAQIMDINSQSVSNLLQSAFKSFRENWIVVITFLGLWQMMK
jgi:RNA polymerase sigma factor (sigma-70 family)